jgi:hypothetical protein
MTIAAFFFPLPRRKKLSFCCKFHHKDLYQSVFLFGKGRVINLLPRVACCPADGKEELGQWNSGATKRTLDWRTFCYIKVEE